MTRGYLLFVAAFCLVFLYSPDPVEAQRRRSRAPELDPEKFDQVATRLREDSDLLELQDGKLKLKFPGDREVNRFNRKMMGSANRSVGRSGGRSGWLELTGDHNCQLTTTRDVQLDVRLDNNRSQSKLFERQHIELHELNHPFRLTEIASYGDQLELLYHNAGQQTVFWLVQTPIQVQIVLVEGSTGVRYTADSLSTMATRYDMSAILETAAQAGFNLQGLGSSEGLLALVTDVLKFTDEDFEAFKDEWSDLDSTDFQTRRDAIEKLRLEFNDWKTGVAYGLLKYGSSSIQFQASLNQAAKTDPEPSTETQPTSRSFDLVHAVVTERLTEDAATLIRLLDRVHDAQKPTDVENTVRQLRKVSGQNSLGDPDEWKKWIAESRVPETIPDRDPADEMTTEYYRYGSARSSLSKLVRLTVGADEKWQLDREAWRKMFGGMEMRHVVRNATARYRETKLPPSWLHIGDGYHPEYVDFPQVMLKEYENQLNKQLDLRRLHDRTFGSRGRKSFNREIESPGVSVLLAMHPRTRGWDEIEKQYFSLNISDGTSRATRLRLHEVAGKECSLLLKSGPRNELLWLHQAEDGSCWIHHATMDGMYSRQATSGKKLFDDNQALITGNAYRLFSEMGVDVSESIGGPLEFQDVPLEVKSK